jgi:hypothetical protein
LVGPITASLVARSIDGGASATADCPARTFVEQVAGLTVRYARQTSLLRRMLEAIGPALADRAGARLATAFGLPVGRSTMLRLVRALPEPAVEQVSVLGVDDFALRRGHVYGAVLVDVDTHRPVDVRRAINTESLARQRCRDLAAVGCHGRAGDPGSQAAGSQAVAQRRTLGHG